jgi:hypothetical protein
MPGATGDELATAEAEVMRHHLLAGRQPLNQQLRPHSSDYLRNAAKQSARA